MCVRGREREGERERESGRERERERERNGYRDNVLGIIAIGFVSIQLSSQSVVTDTEDCPGVERRFVEIAGEIALYLISSFWETARAYSLHSVRGGLSWRCYLRLDHWSR